MSALTILEALRDSLATVPGVLTCRIGLEDGICPDDYPLIRVVPSRLSAAGAIDDRQAEVLIYFGMPIQPFDDTPDAGGRVRMEKLYAALLGMESAIIGKLAVLGAVYQDTITDEDRLETFKMMAVRCEIEG